MKQAKVWIATTSLVVVAGAIGIIIAVTGHKSSGMHMAMASSAVATHQVTIKNYMFSPMVIKVSAGTTVTWTNQDSVNHTVTADTTSGNAPSSMDIGDGKSYSFTFTKAGTYTYHCFPHPFMHGTVIVQ